MNKTILVIIDGCRSDGLEQAKTPNIDYMIENGTHTLKAQTVTPSITLPAHFSIFTSLPPTVHNVLANTVSPDPSSTARSIIDVAKDFGKTTAAFYSWEHLRNLSAPGSLDHSYFINSGSIENLDLEVAQAAAGCLKSCCPDFCFIYLEGTDIAGHRSGFMSTEYLDAIETADTALGIILNELKKVNPSNRHSIILHSDHGGIDHHHTENTPEVMTVPWIAFGPEVRQKHIITDKVNIIDTAPTLAGLMDIPSHYTWQGRAISEIFKPNVFEMVQPEFLRSEFDCDHFAYCN
ncbi:MAG: sulfatase-like hydrolase/transferase [Desulfobacteraceae bacterium]|nr:sulfatase-like hydrolase/transferase [Desulfobacteraceae bacterium]MBC2719187.1 alkaline phosphatase family protein [Desulfobacteraceae bacterium]